MFGVVVVLRVLLYCNRLLAVFPNNRKARAPAKAGRVYRVYCEEYEYSYIYIYSIKKKKTEKSNNNIHI